MSSLRDVANGTMVSRFLAGASFAASGIGYTFRHRRLLLLSLVPMAVQAIIFGILLFIGSRYIGGLVERFGPEDGHWYSFVGAILYVALVILLVLVSLVGSIFITGVVCDPFYDVVSEQVESIMLGRDVGQPFSVPLVVRGIVLELGATIVRMAVYFAVAFPIWLIGLTGVGSIIAVPLGLAWSWLFVALAGLSRSMARHAMPGKTRISAVFSQKACALGFGAVGWVLAYVPLTAPFLVVGGTRLYLALAAHDRIQSSLTADDKAKLKAAT